MKRKIIFKDYSICDLSGDWKSRLNKIESLTLNSEYFIKTSFYFVGGILSRSSSINKDLSSRSDLLNADPLCQSDILFEAISVLHRARVVHGDIKLTNLFPFRDRLLIGDFEPSLVLAGVPMVTRPFVHPDDMATLSSLGPTFRTDIFNLFCLFLGLKKTLNIIPEIDKVFAESLMDDFNYKKLSTLLRRKYSEQRASKTIYFGPVI